VWPEHPVGFRRPEHEGAGGLAGEVVRRASRDEGEGLGFGHHVADGERHAGADDAADHVDLVLANELAELAHALVGLGLIVLDNKLDRPIRELASGLGYHELQAGPHALAERRKGARQGRDQADLERTCATLRESRSSEGGQGNCAGGGQKRAARQRHMMGH
jgi:hypothetical protein